MATAQLKAQTYVEYVPHPFQLYVGYCNANETVTILWKVVGSSFPNGSNYVYIEYHTASGLKKRGYVKYTDLKNISGTVSTFNYPSSANSSYKRYANKLASTFMGPHPDQYYTAGSISRGEEVTYLGKKESPHGELYAFIEYDVQNGAKKKHANEQSKELQRAWEDHAVQFKYSE